MSPSIYALLSTVVISLISLIGITTLTMARNRLSRVLFLLVALAVGSMLGDVFFHLLPESYGASPDSVFPAFGVLAGIFAFFILEKIFRWRHEHAEEGDEHGVHPMGQLNITSDALHNFVDGILIGAAYLVSIPIGIATTIAIILHEIPQEIGDFGILLHSGYTVSKAIFFNFLSALSAVLGTILALILGAHVESFATLMIPFIAGGFIYIAGSDLIPELHKSIRIRKALLELLMIFIGAYAMYLLLFLE